MVLKVPRHRVTGFPRSVPSIAGAPVLDNLVPSCLHITHRQGLFYLKKKRHRKSVSVQEFRSSLAQQTPEPTTPILVVYAAQRCLTFGGTYTPKE